MSSEYETVLSEATIGDCTIRNRIVMPPMATNYGTDNGAVTERMKDYYAERAKGGTGLIVVQNDLIDAPVGRNVVNELRIDKDKFIPGHAELAERIHNHGATAFVQLHHAGRETSLAVTEGVQPVAPSEVTDEFLGTEPRKLATEEVEEVVQKFVDAADRIHRAGFDGVELHGAHGYLIGQFISPKTNKREDKYGGNLVDRLTFPLEIIDGIHDQVGEDFPICFRLSVDEFVEGGHGIEESKQVARQFEDAGIDALHTTAGIYESMPTLLEPMRFEEGWRTYLSEELKEILDIPVIAVGVIRRPETAERIVVEGAADFVAMGRSHIADPNIVRKMITGRGDEINKCISCNVGCIEEGIFGDKAVGCAVNPTVGREREFNELGTAESTKTVAVVGGGPGGIEAAIWAEERGHDVTLYEAADELGGQLTICSKPPGKGKIDWFSEYLRTQVERSSIRVETGIEVTPDDLEGKGHEVVVLATGARPATPDIPGADRDDVGNSWEVLSGEVETDGRSIIVVGGGQVACETAEFLHDHGKTVTMIEMLDDIALDGEDITRFDMLEQFSENDDITWHTGERVVKIEGSSVVTEGSDGSRSEFEGDDVVLALGSEPVDDLVEEFKAEFPAVYLLGDAKEPRKIHQAVNEGAEVGISIGAAHKTYSPLI